MISLPLSTTSAVFAPPPAGAEFDFGGTGYSYGNFVVYNASVFLSIKKGATQGQSTWGPEFAIGPSALQIAAGAPAGARPHGSDLIFGVRARTYSSDRPWSATTSYVVGDTVIEGNIVYVSILASTNQQPPNATFWTAVAATVFGAFFQPGEVSLSATSQTASSISGGGVVNPCPCGSGGGGVTICNAVQSCQWIELDTIGPAVGPDGYAFEVKDTTTNGINVQSEGGVNIQSGTTGELDLTSSSPNGMSFATTDGPIVINSQNTLGNGGVDLEAKAGADMVFTVNDSGGTMKFKVATPTPVNVFVIESDGAAGSIAFFNKAAVPQQATPVTLGDVIALLKAYGLCP